MSEHFEGKNLVELLDLLEPVPEPQAISLFPQTPGWIFLGILVAASIAWAAWAVHRHHRENAYRRAALSELSRCEDDTARIATVLRRSALAGYARSQVAGLTGADWLGFLNESYGGSGFSGHLGQTLLAAPYRQSGTDPALTKLARDWITKHQKARR